jgi:ATP-dependent Clp protease ATP-binding subunit ClpC
MFTRFTDRARKVMQLANQEAQWLEDAYVGPEHILLGLVREGDGLAAVVLKNRKIDLSAVRMKIEKLSQNGPERMNSGRLPLTPKAKKIVRYSMEEANNRYHACVCTEHLLLGLLREPEGMVVQILWNLGLASDAVRTDILKIVGGRKRFMHPARRLGLWVHRHRTLLILCGMSLALLASAILLTLFPDDVTTWVALAAVVGLFLQFVILGFHPSPSSPE